MDQTPELILNVNKPLDWTSFDVVNRFKFYIKRNFPLHKKIKIGHAGTLDPLATGVLIVCLGKATKKIDGLQNTIKEYEGTITLGATTPSYDLETEIDQTYSIEHITHEKIREVAQNFIGKQQQVPPVYSAKKIDGVRAYEMAREGIAVEMRSNEIEILGFEIVSIDLPNVDFRITCTKGTYIRSIAHDFGKKLDNGAHLSRLIRTSSGEINVKNSLSVEECIAQIDTLLGNK